MSVIRRTYHVVVGDVKGAEGGGKAAATVVSLRPSEGGAIRDDGGSVGIGRSSS